MLGFLCFTCRPAEDTVSLFDSRALLPCPLVPPLCRDPGSPGSYQGVDLLSFSRPGVSSRRDAFQHALWLQQEAHWFVNLLIHDDESVDDGDKFSAP